MSARRELLTHLRENIHRPLSREEIYKEFDISKGQKIIFDELISELLNEGLLYKNSSGQYGVPEKFDLIGGRVEKIASGNGFLIPDDPEQEDIFIASENMNGAMHNDKVFVHLIRSRRGKSKEGEIAEIIERVNKKVVGNLEKYKNYAFLIPDNQRICNDIFIPPGGLKNAKNGQKVVTRITKWPEKNRNPEGEVIEILGFKDEPGVDIEAIIRQLDLPGDFSQDVVSAAESISDKADISVLEEDKERVDLRNLKLVTIDGADAKDLDDAVSIEKLSDGKYRLGVHIAD